MKNFLLGFAAGVLTLPLIVVVFGVYAYYSYDKDACKDVSFAEAKEAVAFNLDKPSDDRGLMVCTSQPTPGHFDPDNPYRILLCKKGSDTPISTQAYYFTDCDIEQWG